MAKNYKINEPTKEIKDWHKRWAKNRAFADGEEAVKALGEKLLSKVRKDDSPEEFERHLADTFLYPATNKIAAGLSGLIFRKPPTKVAQSGIVELLMGLISSDGKSIDGFSAWTVREMMVNNFGVVLPDHPDKAAFNELTAGNAINKGYRPYVNGYTAEKTLEVTKGIRGAQVKLVHVRLLEKDDTQVRQLLLDDDGFYEVRLHQKGEGEGEGEEFIHIATYKPTIDGKRLTDIPAEIMNIDGSHVPTPSMLQHCVDLNHQHYRIEGKREAVLNLTQAPIFIVRGFDPGIDPATGEDKKEDWDVSAGAVWEFKDKDVEVDYHIFEPKGYELLERTSDDLKDALSVLGHSMIAGEKPAPEATAAHLLRAAAENATLASFTAKANDILEKAYKRWAAWADPAKPDFTYKLNMDFQPAAMSAQEHKELRDDWIAGAITLETYLNALVEGEVLPSSLDVAAEQEKVEQAQLDRPTAEL